MESVRPKRSILESHLNEMKYETKAGENEFVVDIESDGSLEIDGDSVDYDFQVGKDPSLYSLILGNRSYELRVVTEGDHYRVLLQGENIPVEVYDERRRRLESVKAELGGTSGELLIKAPMPGLVVDVLVAAGDAVTQGQTLVILESMKMHNEFKASRDAVVSQVRVQVDDKVLRDDTLLILE